jgi:hypothetical protein
LVAIFPGPERALDFRSGSMPIPVMAAPGWSIGPAVILGFQTGHDTPNGNPRTEVTGERGRGVTDESGRGATD